MATPGPTYPTGLWPVAIRGSLAIIHCHFATKTSLLIIGQFMKLKIDQIFFITSCPGGLIGSKIILHYIKKDMVLAIWNQFIGHLLNSVFFLAPSLIGAMDCSVL